MLPGFHSLIHLSPQCDARIIGLVQRLTFAMVSLPISLVSTMVPCQLWYQKLDHCLQICGVCLTLQNHPNVMVQSKWGRNQAEWSSITVYHHIPIPQYMGKLFSTCLLNNLINFEDSISNNNNIPEHSKKILHFLLTMFFFSFEFLLLSLKFSVFLKVGNLM